MLRAQFPRFGDIAGHQACQGRHGEAPWPGSWRPAGTCTSSPTTSEAATAIVPNDPQFPSQWASTTTGPTAASPARTSTPRRAGAPGDGAPGVVVGILDSGALPTHQDLLAKCGRTRRRGRRPPTLINDTTGNAGPVQETDGANGLNAVAQDRAPTDGQTWATGRTSRGSSARWATTRSASTGVAWTVQLMELKFLDSTGSGSISDELPCIEYAIKHGVERDQRELRRARGARRPRWTRSRRPARPASCSCAPPATAAENNDISPVFPADYPLDNIICVGATDNRDLPVVLLQLRLGLGRDLRPGRQHPLHGLCEHLLLRLCERHLAGDALRHGGGRAPAGPSIRGTPTGRPSTGSSTAPTRTRRLTGKAQTGGRLDLAKALGRRPSTPPNAPLRAARSSRASTPTRAPTTRTRPPRPRRAPRRRGHGRRPLALVAVDGPPERHGGDRHERDGRGRSTSRAEAPTRRYSACTRVGPWAR